METPTETMDVEALIRALDLAPHPEGGFYRETFRAERALDLPRGERAASTAIYFLLPPRAFSAWHRVASDEVWHHYRGGAVELHLLDAAGHRVVRLGPAVERGEHPQAVVTAGVLQAAVAGDLAALCGCTVAPGFDFADFELPHRAALLRAHPNHAALIHRFTRVEGDEPR